MINKELKEVSLYPDKIVMTNNNDMMIVIDDAEGIIIQCAKKITFKSDKAITMVSVSADLNILGNDRVYIEVGGTKIELTGDVTYEGGSVFMQ